MLGLLKVILEHCTNNPLKIEDLLFEESVGELYSTLDFQDGFLQILLHEDCWKYLGFEVEGQVFMFKRLQFGTSVSSVIFNRIA